MSDTEKVTSEIKEGNGKPVQVTILLGLLKVIFFVYDVIVYLPFQIFANPEEKLARSARTKARPTIAGDPTSPWRHESTVDGDLAKVYFPGAFTVAEVWQEANRRHPDNDCFGTREVLQVHKEKQPNGKIFEKWELGKYHFRSCRQVDARVNLVASGLAAIGLKQKEYVVIFAETREEWMTAALACFKQNYPIATVYATLGEEAVEFAINQVEADTIFTAAPLIPKVYSAIANGAKIRNVIYFESQDPIERTKSVPKHDAARVLSFEELINLGNPDEEIPLRAAPEDVAMTMYTSGTTGNPKGVMLTHANIVAATCGQTKIIDVNFVINQNS